MQELSSVIEDLSLALQKNAVLEAALSAVQDEVPRIESDGACV